MEKKSWSKQEKPFLMEINPEKEPLTHGLNYKIPALITQSLKKKRLFGQIYLDRETHFLMTRI